MTEEQRNLLLKDLSARIPYNVKAQIPDKYGGYTSVIESVDIDEFVTDSEGKCLELTYIKPYLFPMSSMTEEQKEELFIVVLDEQVSISDCSFNDMTGYSEILTNYIIDAIDWFNKNHFDYRGLIPMGLALDATGLNIY